MLKISRLFLALSFFQILLISCKPLQPEQKKIKYVFLFIGDGMGVAQVNAAEAFLAVKSHKKGFKHLTFTDFPNVGLASTFANNRFITESAAAGTALATGNKTNLERISMDSTGTIPMKTIAETFKENGMKVGILSSVSINHATPAAFYAHQPKRNQYFEIGIDLANSSVDYFGGGGVHKAIGTIDGKELNIIDLAQKNGFTYINTIEGFNSLKNGDEKIFAVSPVLDESEAMPFSIDAKPGDLTLADFTAKAIELLENENGFFIMVEGGKIDWACHSNDVASVVNDVMALNEAVKQAKKFYDQHPDETLIVVTADHETGGMALGNRNLEYETDLDILAYQKISIDSLENIEDEFRKSKTGNKEKDFENMMTIINENFGLGDSSRINLIDGDILQLQNVFLESVYPKNDEKSSHQFSKKVVAMLNEKAGIGWTTGSHTGINVPVYAIGTGSESFSGYIDNTDIPKTIESLLGIKQEAFAAK